MNSKISDDRTAGHQNDAGCVQVAIQLELAWKTNGSAEPFQFPASILLIVNDLAAAALADPDRTPEPLQKLLVALDER